MNSCPVCHQDNWRLLYKISDFNIMECLACKFAQIDPFPVQSTRADFYSETAIENRHTQKKRNLLKQIAASLRHMGRKITGHNKSNIFAKFLHKYIKPGSRLLDIGCGTGAILINARIDYVCTGIEISPHLAQVTQNRLGVEVITGDFCNVDFGNHSFDCITMVSLLEHLPNPVIALKKCYELLTTNGYLILKTVNHQGVNRRILGSGWSGYRPPDHMVYFGPVNLALLLEKTGFSNIETRAGLFNDNFYCIAKK